MKMEITNILVIYNFVRILYIKCQKQKGNQFVQYEVLIRKKIKNVKQPVPENATIIDLT